MSQNRMTVGGLNGELRWSYHAAATVGKWTVIADATGHRLTADLVSVDTFAVAQRPLMFIVNRPLGRSWRWAVESLQLSGQALTATLIPQE